MAYVVFSQSAARQLPFAELLIHARRFFAIEVEVLGEGDGSARVGVSRAELRATFTLEVEPTRPELLERARRAEIAGKAGGMASLAERCPSVWTITPEPGAPDTLLLEFVALLASVLLGPVLPPDDSTLFGVRGARERAQKA